MQLRIYEMLINSYRSSLPGVPILSYWKSIYYMNFSSPLLLLLHSWSWKYHNPFIHTQACLQNRKRLYHTGVLFFSHIHFSSFHYVGSVCWHMKWLTIGSRFHLSKLESHISFNYCKQWYIEVNTMNDTLYVSLVGLIMSILWHFNLQDMRLSSLYYIVSSPGRY